MTINSTSSMTDGTSATSSPTHRDHRYETTSVHTTSEGRISYQWCACGLWRVVRYPRAGAPALEAVVDAYRTADRGSTGSDDRNPVAGDLAAAGGCH